MQRYIEVRTSTDAFHRWENAEGKRDYLAHAHRHLFHVRVKISVEHNDREVEFHDLLDTIKDDSPIFAQCAKSSKEEVNEFLNWSCESHAEAILNILENKYGKGCRYFEVEVNEDNECGAILTNED